MDTAHSPRPALSALVDILAAADAAAYGDADLAPHAAALAPLVATSPDLAPLVAALTAGDRALARGELDVLAAGTLRIVKAAPASRGTIEQLFVAVSLVALDAHRAWLRATYGEDAAEHAAADHTRRIADAVRDAAASRLAEADPAGYLDHSAESFERQAESTIPMLRDVTRGLAVAYRIAARLVRAYLAGESVDVFTAVRLTSASSAQPVAREAAEVLA